MKKYKFILASIFFLSLPLSANDSQDSSGSTKDSDAKETLETKRKSDMKENSTLAKQAADDYSDFNSTLTLSLDLVRAQSLGL